MKGIACSLASVRGPRGTSGSAQAQCGRPGIRPAVACLGLDGQGVADPAFENQAQPKAVRYLARGIKARRAETRLRLGSREPGPDEAGRARPQILHAWQALFGYYEVGYNGEDRYGKRPCDIERRESALPVLQQPRESFPNGRPSKALRPMWWHRLADEERMGPRKIGPSGRAAQNYLD